VASVKRLIDRLLPTWPATFFLGCTVAMAAAWVFGLLRGEDTARLFAPALALLCCYLIAVLRLKEKS
jgi:hypothetical protein